jgi:phospho-N-acetylmuramoyl-pentapeptide-transferase
MLSYLSDYEHIFGPLRLFKYITLRALCAGLFAMIVGFSIAPMIIAWLQRFKQSFRNQAQVGKLADLHASKGGTPTMGGLLIFLMVTVSSILFAKLNVYVWVAIFVYAGLTGVGFMDDYLKVTRKNTKGVRSCHKLCAQGLIVCTAVAVLLAVPTSHVLMRELWIPFFKAPLIAQMSIPFFAIFLFFVVAGSSNAINLTDGVDGLAIGCTITVALTYLILSYVAGHKGIAEYLLASYVPGAGELAVICAALVGSSVVFLWYNAYPAEVFMGDTGSLGIGGLIGSIAFMVHQPFTLVIVGGIFVMEALSVILQVTSFKITGKRIFRMAPMHHHFELKGWPEPKVVIRFWILSLIFALIGLATLKIR